MDASVTIHSNAVVIFNRRSRIDILGGGKRWKRRGGRGRGILPGLQHRNEGMEEWMIERREVKEKKVKKWWGIVTSQSGTRWNNETWLWPMTRPWLLVHATVAPPSTPGGSSLHPWRLLPLQASNSGRKASSVVIFRFRFRFPPPPPSSSFLLPPSVPPPPPTHQKFHQFSPSEVATVAIVANAANGDPVPGFWSGILYLPVTGNLKESPNIPENHQESRKIPKNSENLRKKSGIPKNPWRIAKKLLKNLIESQQFSKNLQRIFKDSSQNPQKSPKSPQNP